MSLGNVLILGGIAYYYYTNVVEKEDKIIQRTKSTADIEQVANGTISQKSNIPEVIVNKVPVNKDLYQLIYNIVYNDNKYILYVLKNWTRVDKPKPFINRIEYNKLTSNEKTQYRRNTLKAGSHEWYQIDKFNGDYNVEQHEPIAIEKIPSASALVDKPLPLGFIPVNYSTEGYTGFKTTTTGKSVNIVTPVNRSIAQKTENKDKLGVTIPLNNLKEFRKLLYTYGVEAYKIAKNYLDGVEVEKYVIEAKDIADDLYDDLMKSNLALEVRKLFKNPIVNEADTAHPLPIATRNLY